MAHTLPPRLLLLAGALLATSCFRGFASEDDQGGGSWNPDDYEPAPGDSAPSRDGGSPSYNFCGSLSMQCGTRCVDLDTSLTDCGECGNVCAFGEQCEDGSCASQCPAGAAYCRTDCQTSSPFGSSTDCGACTPLATDADNCGGCGIVCPANQRCTESACGCAAGLASCGTACADLDWDSAHCGGCDQPCGADQVCRRGTCAAQASEWPTLGFDTRRSGFNSVERGTPPLTPDWTVSVSAYPLNAVAISDGRVVATSNSNGSGSSSQGLVSALDVETGRQLWSEDLGNVAGLTQPTFVDGRVYIQNGKGFSSGATSQLRVLDSEDGRVVWSVPIASQWGRYLTPTVTDSAVYANGGTYGGLYGLSRATGRELFHNTQVEQEDAWVAAVYDGDVYTFVRSTLRQHDARTGFVGRSLKASSQTSNSASGPAFSSDGMVYLAGSPTLYAFEIADARLVWQAPISATTLPAVVGELVLAYDRQFLTAFDAKTGAVAWRSLDTEPLSSDQPIAAAGFAYVAGGTTTYAIDLRDGQIAWQTAASGDLSVAAGRLFVASGSGLLYTFKLTPAP